jgi:hypothetical protein
VLIFQREISSFCHCLLDRGLLEFTRAVFFKNEIVF